MNITTTGVLSPAIQQSFMYSMLPTPESELIFNLASSKMNLPAGGGDTLKMRRYNNLDAALVPLGTSGVQPPPQEITATDITATISFYGTYVYINEQVVLLNQEDVLANTFLRLGYSAALTEDTLIRDMLASTASQINCTGGVNGKAVAVVKPTLIDLELLAA